MIEFNCFACKRNFQAERFNVARVNISCPVCETSLNIAQSLGRVYGKLVGEQISKVMSALERLLGKSKNGDLNPAISLAQHRIESLCKEGV
jgi:hypothetical protein